MHRTTLMIPGELKTRAERKARQFGMSFGEFVRTSVEDELARYERGDTDPLLADKVVYRGAARRDATRAHDAILYGDEA